MVNLEKKAVTEAIRIYSLTYQKYAKVLNDKVMKFDPSSNTVEIYSAIGFGSNPSAKVDLAIEAPANNINSLCANGDSVYFYWDSVGVCCFTIDGAVHTLIPQTYIQIKDHQTLDRTNIWDITVGDRDHIAFYDNSLNSIRMIQKVQ